MKVENWEGKKEKQIPEKVKREEGDMHVKRRKERVVQNEQRGKDE